MFTIKATVHHGNYLHSESATAETVEGALDIIAKTPMGVGYCIKSEDKYYPRVANELKTKGKSSLGWANYTKENA